MVLRRRKPIVDKFIQDLDVFDKVEGHYVEQTLIGALVNIVTWICVGILIWSECVYFFDPAHKFRFLPDDEPMGSLDFYVDLTVAMPCDGMGSDITDSLGQDSFSYERLKEDPALFELDSLQRKHLESVRYLNEYMREEYHSIRDLLWKSNMASLGRPMPERQEPSDKPSDACRIHGSLTLNKVEGVFHITPGKSLKIPEGHVHLMMHNAGGFNFSHRIDAFSFGSHSGILQPLQGDEKIDLSGSFKYQYFVRIVPTEVHTLTGTVKTYQYSVTEHVSNVDSEKGMPGVYFKYDFSALKLVVSQDRDPWWRFLVKLCAGIGGMVSTAQLISGLLHSIKCLASPSKSPTDEKKAASKSENKS